MVTKDCLLEQNGDNIFHPFMNSDHMYGFNKTRTNTSNIVTATMVIANNASTYHTATTTASSTAFSDNGTAILPSGRRIVLYY